MAVQTIRAAAQARRVPLLILLTLSADPLIAVADEPAYPPIGAYPVMRVVGYDDLNLASNGDAKKLYGRLLAAARTVCNARRSYPRNHIKTMIRSCVTNALNDAVNHVNAPLLTAYHQSWRGVGQSDEAVAIRE